MVKDTSKSFLLYEENWKKFY